MPAKQILVVGASGLAGFGALKQFAAMADWDVVAVSRLRPRACPDTVRHIPLDLLDPARCAAEFARMPAVTHIAYCAVNEKEGDLVGGWSDPAQAAKNMAMLRNVLDPVLDHASDFRHIGLVHGFKAYCSHMPDRMAPVPFKESMPRIAHENLLSA